MLSTLYVDDIMAFGLEPPTSIKDVYPSKASSPHSKKSRQAIVPAARVPKLDSDGRLCTSSTSDGCRSPWTLKS